MRKLIASTLIICVLALLGLIGATYWLTRPMIVPAGTFIEINRGSSTRSIAERLAQLGVIRSPWALIVMRELHPHARLQAGEYEFHGAVTPAQVFETLRRGLVFYEELTIPEGSNMFDIAALLESTDTIQGESFLTEARNPLLIRDLDPAAPSLEGYLFPSTYRVTHHTMAKDLCRMMTVEFRHQWNQLNQEGGVHADVHQTVTLASLVEKETAIAVERPLVAAVFYNRLELHMPLQCDPTTVYAALVENRYKGVIHRSDLASRNAYNTYAHVGLPPGPIANPGVLALKAALYPAKSPVLYFVAKGDGSNSHSFSATLAAHEAAVANYRKTRR